MFIQKPELKNKLQEQLAFINSNALLLCNNCNEKTAYI